MSDGTFELPAELQVDLKLKLVSVEPVDGGVRVAYVVADIMSVRKELQIICGPSELADVPARMERMLRAGLSNALAHWAQTRPFKAMPQDIRQGDEPPNWMGW